MTSKEEVNKTLTAVIEAMQDAFECGKSGSAAPDVITALRATRKPFAVSTADLIETAYTDGLKARG